jgi:hypothetical protein
MRTIILSDITETDNSIIPYGLNIGKIAQTKVDIIHCFDPVIIKGTYSPYSDSQSFTPGQKLSHEEILHREKGIINDKLSRFLSREASVLNYPLRVNTITEIGNIESCITEQIIKHENPLIITGTKPGGSMTVDLQELLKIIAKHNAMVMIIPPGKKFVPPDTCWLVTDLYAEGKGKIKKLFDWINPLVTKVFTSVVVRVRSKSNHEKDIGDWKAVLQPYAEKTDLETLEIFRIGNMHTCFAGICDGKNYKMAVLPKNKNSFFSKYLLAHNNAKKLTESINIPVLLY